MNFASDNTAPASERVLAALVAANQGNASAYGTDIWTKRAEQQIAALFERECQVFLVSTGTAANALALSSLTPPWGAIFCHEQAHIISDECGAPEFFTHGARLVGIGGSNGKITPAALQDAIAALPKGVVHNMQPAALSLSQATESGTVYTADELAELSTLAHKHQMPVHMDGARFANALLHLGLTPAEMSWKAGIDVVSLGASKNGAFACEAVVFFDPAKAENFGYLRKRAGHTLSKGRLLGAQMAAYLEGDHWLELAAHANAMAQTLANGLAAVEGIRLVWPREANELFVILPAATAERLKASGAAFYDWRPHALPPAERPGENESFIRLICSFTTTPAEVAEFLRIAAG